MYFLDTNICIYFLNGKHQSIRDTLLSTPPNLVKISAIVHAELIYGVQKSEKKEYNLKNLESFLLPFEIVPFTSEMSAIYGSIRHQSQRKGYSIGPNDLLIASTVLFYRGSLVTRNIRELSRIEGLSILEW